jgi:hypothetical protein
LQVFFLGLLTFFFLGFATQGLWPCFSFLHSNHSGDFWQRHWDASLKSWGSNSTKSNIWIHIFGDVCDIWCMLYNIWYTMYGAWYILTHFLPHNKLLTHVNIWLCHVSFHNYHIKWSYLTYQKKSLVEKTID